jgi:hypothetical protein
MNSLQESCPCQAPWDCAALAIHRFPLSNCDFLHFYNRPGVCFVCILGTMEHYSDPEDEMWTMKGLLTLRGKLLEALPVGRACECLDDVYPLSSTATSGSGRCWSALNPKSKLC